jgi:hypothetical protein
MKLHKIKIILSCLVFCLAINGLQAENVFNQARIYIDAGHGGWGSGDRPLATVNYAALDSNSFFESNANLWKALALREELERAGAGHVRMNRTINGIGSGSSPAPFNYPQVPHGTVVNGQAQLITLSVIARDVEENNIDYFLSIHSDAADNVLTNHLVLLYRGWDDQPGNGLTYARDMARAAWPWLMQNGTTSFLSHTAPTANNSRGDMSFYGGNGIEETPIPGGTTYRGHLGVLRHGADGFLSEGGFHTYQPERHRKLNRDYCHQFGVRYSRAIRDWFGDKTEMQGHIMGSIKDKSLSMQHQWYNFRIMTTDEHYPLNNATVILQDLSGTELARYTTDHQWNGIFVFPRLNPGTYKLVFEPVSYTPIHSTNNGVLREYERETLEIEVKANETSFINFTFGGEPEPPFFCDIYPQPEQDGNIAAASEYDFELEGEVKTIDPLAGLTVRRSLMRDGKMYVLAVDAERMPKLLVINPETGALIKEMSTEGIDLRNHATNISDVAGAGVSGPNPRIFPLSDIAFTADGVLLGVNSSVVGAAGNQFLTGADFNVYKWQAEGATALEDATPTVFLTVANGGSMAQLGNNLSNFVGNTMTVAGCLDNFKMYFESHPGPSWTMSDFQMMFMGWHVEDGEIVRSLRNLVTDLRIATNDGASVRINISPFDIDRLVLEGSLMKPRELNFNWGVDSPTWGAAFSGDIPTGTRGANYFRYANSIFMVVPIAETTPISAFDCKVSLFDITRGFDNADLIGETDFVQIPGAGVPPMASFGVVDNADIDVYILAGNRLAKYRTSGMTEGTTRIFAYNLSSTYNDINGYTINFELNYNATSVELILTNPQTKAEVKVIPLGKFAKGAHQTILLNADIPEDDEFNWSIRARANNVTQFNRISDPNDAAYRIFGARSAAMDKTPESEYFGRVYITAADAGTVEERTTQKGIYVLSPVGKDITGQGNTAYSGDLSWSGTAGQNFRKAVVDGSGRIFIADASVETSGIYIMNPATFEMTQMFTGTRDERGRFWAGTGAANYIGGRTNSVGIRGTGSDTRLYALVNHDNHENTWTQLTRAYDIGEGSTWSDVASWNPTAGNGSANGNNSIQPVEGGFWAAQLRFAGGNLAANPFMHFYSETRPGGAATTWRTSDTGFNEWMTAGSENGGMAVFEQDGLIALSYNNGIQIFQYELGADGVPVVTPLFHQSLGGGIEDFEFDYAGNLYAVSATGNAVSVWGVPTGNNVSTTPARSSMLIEKGEDIQLPVHEYSAAICEGETHSDEHFTDLTTAGVHQTTNATHIVKLTLTVHPVETHEYSVTIKEGETYEDEYFTIENATMADNKTHENTSTTTAHGCQRTVRLHLTVEPGVSVEIVNLNNAIQIFPNPVRNELNISIVDNLTIQSLQIIDLSGKSVQMFINSTRQVDVSTLSQGIYFVKIETDKGTVVKRFVKE